VTLQQCAIVFEATGARVPSERLVLLEVAYRADKRGVVRASQSELSSWTGLSRRTVAECFLTFERAGVMTREGHGRYRLDISTLEGEDGPEMPIATRSTTMNDEARLELERLQKIRRPDESIMFQVRGKIAWPVLRPA
jgi:hypothetical protein